MSEADEMVANLIKSLDPGAFVTQFVIIAEVIDKEGDRCVWMETHEEASKWDTYGLLTHALQKEKAHHFALILEDDGEDEGP